MSDIDIKNTVTVDDGMMERELDDIGSKLGLPSVSIAEIAPDIVVNGTNDAPSDTGEDAQVNRGPVMSEPPIVGPRRREQLDKMEVSCALLDKYPDVNEDRIKLEVCKLADILYLSVTSGLKFFDLSHDDEIYDSFCQNTCEAAVYIWGFGESETVDYILLFGAVIASAAGVGADVRSQLKSRKTKNAMIAQSNKSHEALAATEGEFREIEDDE